MNWCGEIFVEALAPLHISPFAHTHGGTGGGFGPPKSPVDPLLDLLMCDPQTAIFLVKFTLTVLWRARDDRCLCRPPQALSSPEDGASDGRSVETDCL